MQNDDNGFKNDYIHFFPSANLTYYLKPTEFWKLSYGKRINYPSSGQLSPFVDITDSLNQHSGNPHLKPEIIHSVELGYNKDWEKYSLASILFYRYSLDVINSYSELNPNGVILSKPMNFGNAITYGLENNLSAHPISFYDAGLSLSLFQRKINGTNVEQDASNDAFCWYGKWINNFIWKKSKLQVTGNYNSPLVTPQGKNIATYYIDMGFQQQLGRNTHIGLVATDVFNTLKSGSILQTSEFVNSRKNKADTRAVLLTFSYTFNSAFKEKLLENKFSAE
jgi:outer membrane receptor protein involved in Fe transport